MIALHDLRSVAIVEILMKSQFYYTTTVLVLPPLFRSFFFFFTCLCFIFLFSLFPRYYFFARSRERFARRRFQMILRPAVLSTKSWFKKSRTRESRAQQPRNKIFNRKNGLLSFIYYRVALSQSCSMKVPRLAASSRVESTRPPFRRGRRWRERASGPCPSGYNLYTKINAPYFLDTLNKIESYKFDFCFFLSYTESLFLFFLPFFYLYKICRSARSTRVDCFFLRTDYSV